MSRWKPPRPKASPYITPEGYAMLEAELQALWQNRKSVVSALSAAAAEGDRSENAEYIYRKKELRGIDSRIHYLQKRLPDLVVVHEKPSDQTRVFFGARVALEEDELGEEVSYRIVGTDEWDKQEGGISIDSPLARAILKKTVDDEVIVSNELRATRSWVLAIDYS
jgi:transcription elongation factor GreB